MFGGDCLQARPPRRGSDDLAVYLELGIQWYIGGISGYIWGLGMMEANMETTILK